MSDLKNKKLDENMLEKISGGADTGESEGTPLYSIGTIVVWKKREWYVTSSYWDFDSTSRDFTSCWCYDLEDCRGLGLTGRWVPEHDLCPY